MILIVNTTCEKIVFVLMYLSVGSTNSAVYIISLGSQAATAIIKGPDHEDANETTLAAKLQVSFA